MTPFEKLWLDSRHTVLGENTDKSQTHADRESADCGVPPNPLDPWNAGCLPDTMIFEGHGRTPRFEPKGIPSHLVTNVALVQSSRVGIELPVFSHTFSLQTSLSDPPISQSHFIKRERTLL